MSSNLYWRPSNAGEMALSDKLKFALRNGGRYGGNTLDQTIYESDIPYFEGLRDAGVEDAQKIIDALEKHSEIELKERF